MDPPAPSYRDLRVESPRRDHGLDSAFSDDENNKPSSSPRDPSPVRGLPPHRIRDAPSKEEIDRAKRRPSPVGTPKGITQVMRQHHQQQYRQRDETGGEAAAAAAEPEIEVVASPDSSRAVKILTQSDLLLNANGVDGLQGKPGRPGRHAVEPGTNGENGHDASLPRNGQNGADLIVHLSTLQADPRRVRVYVTTSYQPGDTKAMVDTIYDIAELPNTIRWIAQGGVGGNGGFGGNGGNGAKGKLGVHAGPKSPASTGGSGGNGGSGGRGTNGANGGRGGNVRVVVDESDMYLITLIDSSLVSQTSKGVAGGLGGQPGAHGNPGRGGSGGDGGNAFFLPEEDQPSTAIVSRIDQSPSKRSVKSASRRRLKVADGRQGIDGNMTLEPLAKGQDGPYGTFMIQVNQQPVKYYPGRYDMAFVDCDVKGQTQFSDDMTFEFGDILSLRTLIVKNTGAMPTPLKQRTWFRVSKSSGPGLASIRDEQLAFLPLDSSVEPETEATAEGELKVQLDLPSREESTLSDFQPITGTAKIILKAFQLGYENTAFSPFRREFRDFHSEANALSLKLCFPVKNQRGLQGCASLAPGEQSKLLFDVTNISAGPLGGASPSGHPMIKRSHRRLALRYKLRNETFKVRGYGERNVATLVFDKGTDAEFSDNNVASRYLPEIAPGAGSEQEAILATSTQAPAYTRCTVKVDLLIEPLQKVPEATWTSFTLVQSRSLQFTVEPLYDPNPEAHVVLVTSNVVTKPEYDAWLKSTLGGMDLVTETYSVSRYGSLDPLFAPDGAKQLKETFKGKLVIILNHAFHLGGDREKKTYYPLDMLPNGVMDQVSGFDSSTTWLIVDYTKEHIQTLLNSHLIEEGTDTQFFQELSKFKKYIDSEMKGATKLGRIDQSVSRPRYEISFPKGSPRNDPGKEAELLRDWLAKEDHVRQYTVESVPGKIVVHQGYSRSQNNAIVVKAASGHKLSDTKVVKSKAMCFAVAEALSLDVRIQCYSRAIQNGHHKASLAAYRHSIVADFLRDVKLFLDAGMKNNSDLELSFPSIGSLLDRVEVVSLIKSAKETSDCEFADTLSKELNELMGSFQAIAHSKDLKSRFRVIRGKNKASTSGAVTEIVNRLQLQWKSLLDDRAEKSRKSAEEAARSFYKSESVANDGRWTKGFNLYHSPMNQNVFGTMVLMSSRLTEMDIDTPHESHSIPRLPIRVMQPSGKVKWTTTRDAKSKQRQTVREAATAWRGELVLPAK